MGVSTVSGPFRSQNGFEELVNGVWTPVGGGGGGSPNDLVVTGKIYPNCSDNIYGDTGCYTCCFIVRTGFTMQQIQDSITAGGKWACYSGYTFCAQQVASLSNSPSAQQGMRTFCFYTLQMGNCIETFQYKLVTCTTGGICYPSMASQCYDFGSGASTSMDYFECGFIRGSCPWGGSSDMSCPAAIFYKNCFAGQCGNGYPTIQWTLRLHFDRLIA